MNVIHTRAVREPSQIVLGWSRDNVSTQASEISVRVVGTEHSEATPVASSNRDGSRITVIDSVQFGQRLALPSKDVSADVDKINARRFDLY
jgi:hypothetical protein